MAPPRTQEPNAGLDRTRHQLRASGIKSESPQPLRSGIHTRGYLPHVKREGASYFVTFRLADSLPKEMLLQLEREKAGRLQRLAAVHASGTATNDSEEEIKRDLQRKIERYLDKGAGSCHLRQQEIADLVLQTLLHFNQDRYLLHEWVAMPNHVHVLFQTIGNVSLADILHSWKSYSAKAANKILGRNGEFWQREYHDHLVRNMAEFERVVRYVIENPRRAGLKNWHWVWW